MNQDCSSSSSPSNLLSNNNRKRKRNTPKKIDSHVALGDAIHRATKPDNRGLRRRSVDEIILKDIKLLVKNDGGLVETSYRYLKELLKRDHAQVRLLAFQVYGELFQRSKAFRGLAVKELKFLMEHAIGTNPRIPLPSPDRLAELLRERALRQMDVWGQKHASYPELRAACRYLTTKKLLLPHIQMHTLQAEAEAERRSETTQRMLRAKYQQALREIPDALLEIQDGISQMEECFKLLVPDMRLEEEPMKDSHSQDFSLPETEDESSSLESKTNINQGSFEEANLKIAHQNHEKKAQAFEDDDDDDNVDWESGFAGDLVGSTSAPLSPTASQISSPVRSRVCSPLSSRASSPTPRAVSSPLVFSRTTSEEYSGNKVCPNDNITATTAMDEVPPTSAQALENFAADTGLGSMNYQLELEIPNILDCSAFATKDMEPILITLKDNYKVFVSRYKPLVEEWINTLTKVELTNSSERNRLLKEILENKSHIQKLIHKCSLLSKRFGAV